MKLKSSSSEYMLYGLVRDSFGIPKIPRLSECHPEILKLLTNKEIEDIKNGTNPYSRN